MTKKFAFKGGFSLGVLPIIALVGCVPEADTCDASSYGALEGANIAAVTLPSDLDMRIIYPGDIVTTDYVAERLNVSVDANGTILGLDCG